MFWFAFETARRGQPHYQGSVLLRVDELKKARAAFYAVNREMTAEEKHQALRFRDNRRLECINNYGRIHADLNWADYNLKEYAMTRREYNNLSAVIATSSQLKTLAKNYYKSLKNDFVVH